MIVVLDEVEGRVLGCLIEKSLTTPELYPLTLNALANACNQKSSREPVMSLEHGLVERGVNSLVEKGYAARRYEPGGRAAKYGHRAEVLLGTEDAQIIGVICTLLLRGAQTLGEIKTRSERLCAFPSITEVEILLGQLAGRVDGPIVERLPRQPGQKETRWRQLFTQEAGAPAAVPPPVDPLPPAPSTAAPPVAFQQAEERLALLERRVAALEDAVEKLAKSRT